MICPECSHKNPDDAKFCAECGAPLPRNCQECGTPLVAGAKFCIECGTAVVTVSGSTATPEPGAAPQDAERRQLTVMFCDLVDSTRMSTHIDPEELRELNRAYRKLCTETIRRYDGYIARYMGDGVLAYFGYPRAHEDDSTRAVRAGLDITAGAPSLAEALPGTEEVAVRIGIATGPVVVGELIGEGPAQEHDVVGETPNLAARLQGLAAANTVVVSDDTRKLLGAAFELESLGHQVLKGFNEPLQAWRVAGVASVETRFEATSTEDFSPFVGREHEYTLIVDCWNRALDGLGQVVLLRGEAGIGKSRITMATRNRLEEGEHIPVRLQCSPYYQNSALYPVIEHLERAAGFTTGETSGSKLDKLERLLELSGDNAPDTLSLFAALLSIPADGRCPPPDLDPDVLRERTLEAVLRQLESLSRRQPLLFLIEDVHWADPTTMDLLNSLVENVRSWRVLAMITFRPEFEPPWLGEAHVSLLALNRLDRSQCETIIGNLTKGKALPEAIVGQILEKTDGVPLFLEEMTRTIIESDLVVEKEDCYVLSGPMQRLAIPATLQDSLMARLDQLDDAKNLAQIGAAIGREFSRDLLTAVSGCGPGDVDSALSRLIESGLVLRRGTGTRTRFSFKHALIQDAAYNSMLNSRRHALHGRIAETLRRDFPDVEKTQPELLAQHYAAAGLTDEARSYWHAAGIRAMESSAHREAIAHFHRGLESLDGGDTDEGTAVEAVTFRTSLAECLRIVDRMDEAFSALQAAEDLAKQFQLETHLSRIHHQRGNLYFPTARTEECLAEHQRALEFARKTGSVEEEVRALGGLGDAFYVSGKMRTATHYFKRCVEISREHGFHQTAAANLSMHGFSRAYLLELTEALQDSTDVMTLAREAGHPRAELLGYILRTWTQYYMGDFELAMEDCQKAEESAHRLGARRFEGQNQYYHALCLYKLGRREEALSLLDTAERLSRQFSPRFTLARVLSGIALVTDDPDRRESALCEGERLLDEGCVSHNYFSFYMDAADACFDHQEWDRMEHYADRLEAYSAAEPLPWSDFVIERNRRLAQWGRGDRSPDTMASLRALLDLAKQAGLLTPAARIQTVVAGDSDQFHGRSP